MKTRILAAAVLLPLLLIIVLVLPKVCTAVLFGAMAALAAYELMQGTKLVTHTRMTIYAMVVAFLVPIWGFFGQVYAYALMGTLVFVALLYMELLLSKGKMPYANLAIAFMAGIVVPFLFTAIVRIFATEKGRFLIFVPFVLAMVSDTGAYFAGKFFGKHKLAPKVSPKKSVEGAIGGLVGNMLAGMLFLWITTRLSGGTMDGYRGYVMMALMGLFCGVVSQIGDLSFSLIKREFGIKDYGKLFLAHGGVLDRFDSVLFVAPVIEIVLNLM